MIAATAETTPSAMQVARNRRSSPLKATAPPSTAKTAATSNHGHGVGRGTRQSSPEMCARRPSTTIGTLHDARAIPRGNR